MYIRTDRVIPIYPPKLCLRGGIIMFLTKTCIIIKCPYKTSGLFIQVILTRTELRHRLLYMNDYNNGYIQSLCKMTVVCKIYTRTLPSGSPGELKQDLDTLLLGTTRQIILTDYNKQPLGCQANESLVIRECHGPCK